MVESIFNKTKDFRREEGVTISLTTIEEWAQQFGDDADFMLAETNNILDKTYLTKEDAVELFRNYIREHITRYQYDDITSYLKDVHFLQLQPAGKSQSIIVDMINNIIQTDYGLNVDDYKTYPKKLYIYFDDVLVTGKTILVYSINDIKY